MSKDPHIQQKFAILMMAGQSGDKVSYNLFLKETTKILRPFISSLGADHNWQDDILQNSLIAIHKYRHTYIPGRPIFPWIYAICRHTTIDHFRKIRRHQKIEDPRSIDVIESMQLFDASNALSDESFAELSDRALKALETLPEKQRRIVTLMKLDGLSVKEISNLTGTTESAIKVNAHRAYEKLRTILKGGEL
ncbi:MAG: sigma-70 family RNA polymerase sigma factor [Proteobacteria bacterium]|nr:sigma-70 family RNA polymerase sigma factor [Pseudomonadota bacterium]